MAQELASRPLQEQHLELTEMVEDHADRYAGMTGDLRTGRFGIAGMDQFDRRIDDLQSGALPSQQPAVGRSAGPVHPGPRLRSACLPRRLYPPMPMPMPFTGSA